MLKKALFMASLSVLLAAPTAQAADWPKQSYLSLELAQKAVNATLTKCKTDGYNVSVAVVDRGGNLLSQSRHPMAGPHTIGSSQGKAFTSASMGRPSGQLAQMIGEKPFLNGLRDMDSRLVILGGGLPIVINGERVGGIGVGGAPGGHLDEECAQEGLAAIGIK
ncbi:MAG: heme-binding protein [Sedimenticola sp.]|nr:heme-binding protein [Sedimenticola sp.]